MQRLRPTQLVKGSALAVCLGGAVLLPTREADGKGARCPVGMALVAPEADPDAGGEPIHAFCMDRYEASLIEITPEGEKPFSPFEMIKTHRVRAVSRSNVVPQAYISRNEAAAACKESKKRLCVENEWFSACQGKKPTLFPYGDTHKPGYCNDAGSPPLVALFPDQGSARLGFEPMNDPRLNQQPGTVSKTGAHGHCTNSFGLFDMVGNLHEWIDDPSGTFRGGYYLDTHINGDGCKYRTVAHDATYHDYSTGFRCCADAK